MKTNPYVLICAMLMAVSAEVSAQQKLSVGPLLKTQWHSQSPYNNQCPKIGEEPCEAGSTAALMAMVMKYYRYPQTGRGNISYKLASSDVMVNYDFEKDHFDWENMLDDYYGVETTQMQLDAVGNLIASCGASVAMQYVKSGSTANAYNIPYALINTYGYNPNLVYYDRDYFSDEEWYKIVDRELDAGRPIMYGGQTTNDWRLRFIVDGRNEEGLYHVNWGLAHNATRTYNGYYNLDTLQLAVWTDGKIYSKTNYKFSEDQTMTCGICPTEQGVHEDVFYANTFSLANGVVKVDQTCDYALGPIYCRTTRSGGEVLVRDVLATVGVGLFDADFNYIQSLYGRTVKCKTSSNSLGNMSGNIRFDATIFEDGKKYYIAPYVLVDGENRPTRIRTWKGKTNHYLAEVENGQIKLSLMGDANGETSIRNIEKDASDYAVYTLSGIQIPHVRKSGVYIVNGKKYLSK